MTLQDIENDRVKYAYELQNTLLNELKVIPWWKKAAFAFIIKYFTKPTERRNRLLAKLIPDLQTRGMAARIL